MTEITSKNVMACQPLKGRESPPDPVGTKEPKKTIKFETKELLFETESFKIKRTPPPRTPSVTTRKPLTPSVRNEEGNYAIRFKNYTWAHTNPDSRDHYPSRSEIRQILDNYEAAIRSITGNDGLERAAGLQSVTDMLLDQLSSQLRAECLEQMTMIERARESYAAIFMLLQEDSQKCRDEIAELNQKNVKLEGDLTKVIDTSSERILEIQEDFKRQIAQKNEEMDQKKQEYDLSMKRFLEQKTQLEEHVKALHRVFLDFQSDSVYITLEDLKQKQAQTEKKLHNKENEITRLNSEIAKLNKRISEIDANKKMVEQANDELRRKLQNTISINKRLERQLKMDSLDGEGEEEDDSKSTNSSEFVASKKARGFQPTNSTPFINVLQKLNQIYDKVSDMISKMNPTAYVPGQYNDDFDKILLSGNANAMIQVVEKKVDEVLSSAEILSNIDYNPEVNAKIQAISQPRFIQYIALHIEQGVQNTTSQQQFNSTDYNSFQHIRQIFQSKYIEDQWRNRTGAKVSRFPEFVISYYMRGDETMFGALQKTGKLWRCVKSDKCPENKLFKRFCLEKYTTDELTFFLQVRYLLIGLPEIGPNTPRIIKVKLDKCKDVLNHVIGEFSHINTALFDKVKKLADEEESIDYALFMINFLEFYERERKKRRNAVRLMFQSKKFAQGESRVDFENYVAMVKSLGFHGNSDTIFELYREATLISESGEMTLDSLLLAMDNIGFHFYSIDPSNEMVNETPVTAMPRNKLLSHWLRFGKWFEGFMKPLGTFDPWVQSQLIKEVQRVDNIFKTNSPVNAMFSEYVRLLDFFQYLLSTLALGSGMAMAEDKSTRELLLLENLTDLLVTFVVTNPDPEFPFSALI